MKTGIDFLKGEKRRYRAVKYALLILLILMILVSVSSGSVDIPFEKTSQVILKEFGFDLNLGPIDEGQEAIIWDIRLPRVLIGLLVGAGLGVAGCIFQAILKNPLADPYTIGVSTGAAFGGTLAIYLNLFILKDLVPVPLFAMTGALVTLVLVLRLSLVNGVRTKSSLILAGIIISSILSAGISFLKATSGEDVGAIIFWLMGNLSSKSWMDLLLVLPVISLGVFMASRFSMRLDIMTLGRHEARNLGVNYDRTAKWYLVIASLITATCVAVSGIIGFVGLVVPHLIRMTITSKNQYLLPLSALAGGLMLVTADYVSRVLLPYELPVGILTTLLGGPFFIYIYTMKRGGLSND